MTVFSHSRNWVYPKKIEGRFQKWHRRSGIVLLAVLIFGSWLQWDGMPLIRVDLPDRRLYLLGEVFTASDGFLIVLLGFLAAFSLFFFTSLFGRLWCGYFCPQTVFLEEWIRPIENLIEGDRGRRMRRDKTPWTFDWTWRKIAKWSVFAGLATFLGMSVVSYFAGPWELWTGQGDSSEYIIVGAIAFLFFWDWAWFREQLCNYLCPYARFQGALTDDHSLVVSYDVGNAEPRGRGKEVADAGRCIDCGKCVQVCPQGIDIRDGFQLECVNCARCVDACEDVMGKLGKPSLVKYTTIAEQTGGRTRWLRPRTVLYAGVLTTVMTLLLGVLFMHSPFEISVNRSPGTLFQVDDDGFVRNTFLLDVKNNDAVASHQYTVQVEGLDNAVITVPPLELGALQERTVPLIVRVPTSKAPTATTEITVKVSDGLDAVVEKETTFKAPR